MSATPTFRDIGVDEVKFGHNVTVVKPANLYGCRIGDDCFIGPFVEIQRGVAVGAGSVVASDIEKPGIYFGSPARFVCPFEPEPPAEKDR